MEGLSPEHYMRNQVAMVIFFIFGISANIMIIYVICRFKKMHTVPNAFLVNWIIADSFCLILTVTFRAYFLHSYFVEGATYPDITIHIVLIEVFITFFVSVALFVLIISIDWFMAAYIQKISEHLRKYYKFVIAFLWMLSLIFCGAALAVALKKQSFYVAKPYSSFIYCVVTFLNIAIQFCRIVRKPRIRPSSVHSIFMLNMATIFVLVRLPQIIYSVAHIVFEFDNVAFEIIVGYILVLHPILNLILLYCFNNDFRACLHKDLKCCHTRYEEAAVKFENQSSFNNFNQEVSPLSEQF